MAAVVVLMVLSAVVWARHPGTHQVEVLGPPPPAGSAPRASTPGPHEVVLVAADGSTPAELQQDARVIQQRLTALGIDGSVRVEGPTVVVTSRLDRDAPALRLLILSSTLQFRPVLLILGTSPPPGTAVPQPSSNPNLPVTLSDGQVVYRLGPVAVGPTAILRASAKQDSATGQWEINPVFKPGADGLDAFNAIAVKCHDKTAECPTGQLAIVVDGQVLAAPAINAASFQADQIQIQGTFTQQSAQEVATAINGSLPANLTVG